MTVALSTGPGRVVQVIWGTRGQNTLEFNYPIGVDEPHFWRLPRKGSEAAVVAGTREAWTTARDFWASIKVRWVNTPDWAGPVGVQAFLDWCSSGNTFTFVPDAVNAPFFFITGCLLVEPFDKPDPALEDNGMQTITLLFRNPTTDIGLAWRGLMFEYAAGGSLTDPVATFTRASIAAYHNVSGKVAFALANVVRDSHYIGTVRMTLFERASVQSALWTEAFDTATSGTTWQKSETTVTADAAVSPQADGAQTADLLLETVINANHYIYQTAITITSTEACAASIYIKAAPRFRGRFYFGDISGTNWFGVDFNLSTGTLGAISNNGAAVGYYKNIVALANGWFRIEIAGNVNGGVTSGHVQVNIYNDAGAPAYVGDITKGLYLWGAQVERWGVTLKLPATSYIRRDSAAASRVTDSGLAYAWTYKPQASWFYVKFTELGTVKNGVNADGGWFRVGTGVGTVANRSLFFVQETGSPQYSFYHRGENDRSVNVSAAAVVIGDTTELLGLLYQDGSVELYVSVNGAADVHAGPSAAFQGGLAFAWSSAFITFGAWEATIDNGVTGIRQFKVGMGVGVNTIAKARAA